MEKIGLNHKNSDFWTILRPMGNLGVYCVNWGEGRQYTPHWQSLFPGRKRLRKLFPAIDLRTCYTRKTLTCPVACRYHTGFTIGGALTLITFPMSLQMWTKTGKFVVGYFPLDVTCMHLTKTVCYDLGENKNKILNIPYTNYSNMYNIYNQY